MATDVLLTGISETSVQTARLRVHVLMSGPEWGVPVLFVHGNMASARFWEETMLALPPAYRAVAPDMRVFGETEALPVDARRGVRDWSDDLKALVDALGLGRFHLVGWSMGGTICMQYAADHSYDLLSLTLVGTVPQFGVGGTRDAQGTPTSADFAGSGAGRTNPELIRRLAEGDRGSSSPFSPRNVLNTFYFKPPFRVPPAREEVFVSAILSTHTGPNLFPGDSHPAPNWPGVSPGEWGVYNAISPRYCNVSAFACISPKPPVLWIRGADDKIVSDESPFDAGVLGRRGLLPGWPGEDAFPPQPMVAQVRHLLESYRAHGGAYREVVVPGCAHSPHIERPDLFQAAFFAHLGL